MHEVKSFDFSGIRAGKVDPTILNQTSEAFLISNHQSVTRVYSKTKIGSIYINEMVGAEMGVIGNSGKPNFYIDNISGYRTTVRYEHEKLATLLLFSTPDGVTFIEIINSFPSENDELKLRKFISTLISDQEGS